MARNPSPRSISRNKADSGRQRFAHLAVRLEGPVLLAIEQLSAAPEMGPRLPQRPSTRFFPVGSYLIIYRLDEGLRAVRILRFWNAARGRRPTR
ncbi:MAG: hypothetical protein DME80_09050 [Verrucomicrobia bacterium]|nr:MAG: hypothetical protein DME89_01905 [Verrucomicrobiota bacterium]PYJ43418.1 MAG: hypothetical protein DME80_09050 [Verrucomicrobiota bacterium]